MLYLAWKHGGACPFRLFNGLTEDFRPLSDPTAPVVPVPHPPRLRAFLYGCALVAAEGEGAKKAMKQFQGGGR